ncbi:MAG: DinB family protein [Gemmatimonadaceae bacterium]
MRYEIGNAIPLLQRTPRTLGMMLRGLPESWTDATEGPHTWSPSMVVAHLLSADQTNWIPRARLILGRNNSRVLPVFDHDAHLRDRRGLHELLDAFEQARAENIATLGGWRLGNRELAYTAEHPELGTVTLRELLASWVAHDLAHISQIARVLAKQYRDAVGPWRVFLRIMDQ